MSMLQPISIILEIIALLLGLALAKKKKKNYGWLIALTFAIYVFYDAAAFFTLNLSPVFLHGIFFVASISMLLAIWLIYREK
jgi:hypothetical protein